MSTRPSIPPPHALQKALGLFGKGEWAKAEKLCRPLLAADPANANLLQLVGILCHRQNRLAEAERLLMKAVRLAPASGEAHYNLGTALSDLGRFEEAVASLTRAAELRPGNHDTHNNLGVALLKSARPEEAEASFRQALAFAPDSPDALRNLGSALHAQGRFAEAVPCFQRALVKGHADKAALFCELGACLISLYRPAEAITALQAALGIKPKYPEAYMQLGLAYLRQDPEQAARYFAEAAKLADRPAAAAVRAWHARRSLCDWGDHGRPLGNILHMLHGPTAIAEPFSVLAVADDPALHRACACRYAARVAQGVPRCTERTRAPRERIRVGYLSADFHEHPTAYLMAGLFELHDRTRFEVLGLSFGGEDTSSTRRRLVAGFDSFVDLSRATPAEIVSAVREAEIDIAVDLKGYTDGQRCSVFAARPAPIQVNYLGYPGTIGGDWMDYVVVDPFLVPLETTDLFTEKLVYLPDSYQVNDAKRIEAAEPPHRAELGLPETGFVFCCFNQSYKITPEVFDVWMRLLKAVPGSVLWLYRQLDQVEANLRREAQARGVDATRLLFAPSLPQAEHVARQRRADLFLDTLPYNAHTTASDALWAGLPVVTCAGRSFASRVAGSLLTAIGMPELITTSLAEYEALALKLATEPQVLAATRAKLARNRLTTALFDTARFTHHLEAAYAEMWQIWLSGEAPRTIRVVPAPR